MVLEKTVAMANATPQGMVMIPAGDFLMGSEEGSEVEKPVHRVYLDAYFMDSTPVTNAQFAEFTAATGYGTTAERLERIVNLQEGDSVETAKSWRTFATPERDNHPVIFVSWLDADAYARWATKRLPTEAEWEKAARGGLDRKRFPWGDEITDHGANWGKTQSGPEAMPPTTPISMFPPNDYGLYDMVGNVWEWCADWYFDPYYEISPEENPAGPDGGQYRVRRGASWNIRESFRLRCANRGAMPPDRFFANLGFRCARTVPPTEG
jgi:formylglycine-generating enzyme required for sulfatase activity